MLPPKGVNLPISKLHSNLAVANLLAHNNKSQICYCGQISLQSAAVNCSFLTPLGVTFVSLAMVHTVLFTQNFELITVQERMTPNMLLLL